MALLNDMYIFVSEENKSRSVDIFTHPVEKGMDISDGIKRKPVTLSLTGELICYETKIKNAAMKKDKTGKIKKEAYKVKISELITIITKLMNSGYYVKYQGVCSLKKALITSFNAKYNADISGGCAFDMELQEIRVAEKAYKTKKKSSSTKQTKSKTTNKKRYHKVKKGETLYILARKYYSDGSKFARIYTANKAKIDKANKFSIVNKYVIHKGQKLEIPR